MLEFSGELLLFFHLLFLWWCIACSFRNVARVWALPFSCLRVVFLPAQHVAKGDVRHLQFLNPKSKLKSAWPWAFHDISPRAKKGSPRPRGRFMMSIISFWDVAAEIVLGRFCHRCPSIKWWWYLTLNQKDRGAGIGVELSARGH